MSRVKRKNPAPRAGIVHLGPGAFCRAHLSIYTEDAITHNGGDWGIVGVSLQSSKLRDNLADQQFAYTALQLNPDQITTRQIEVFNDLLVARENPQTVLQRMADPAVNIVSMTITEKGYCIAPASGTLDLQHPDIKHDIENSLPVSAPGFIVRSLALRQQAGHAPFTVLSCDNLPENGRIIRRIVLELAAEIDPALADWIQQHGRFPSTMVDRITPATTMEDLETVKSLTGHSDSAPVVHEPFSQWVIEDSFVNSKRPDWASAGAELVTDVRPYELMKLRMLNGTHSALAYLGYLAGFKTIADTVADENFSAFTQLLWNNEIIPTVAAPPGVSLKEYAEQLLSRYTNPSIRHLTWQIAMDGSQKLPQRVLGTVDEQLRAEANAPGLILVIAAWMRYVSGIDESGEPIDVRDPMADKFKALATSSDGPEEWVLSLLALREVFPAEIAEQLSEPLTQIYMELLEHGAHAMVRQVVVSYRA